MVLARICGNEDQTRVALDDAQKRPCDEAPIDVKNMIKIFERNQRDQEMKEVIPVDKYSQERTQKLTEKRENLKATETNLTKETAGPSQPPPKNEKTAEIGNEDGQPKSHGSQRSAGSKKPINIAETSHPSTLERAKLSTSRISGSSEPPQPSKSGPHPSSAGKSGNEDGQPKSHGSQRSAGSKKSNIPIPKADYRVSEHSVQRIHPFLRRKSVRSGNKDGQPKSHGSQRSAGSKKDHIPIPTVEYPENSTDPFKPTHNLLREPIKTIEDSNPTTPDPLSPERARYPTHLKSVISNPRQPSESGPRPNSAGKSETSDLEKPEYDRVANQKGFMLIINYSKDREGSRNDVKTVRNFFEETLNFKVEVEQDLTLDDLKIELKGVRKQISGEGRKRYRCFILVIMGHGNKDGIWTNDEKQITMNQIIDIYREKEMLNYHGKPKIVIVQSCRGPNESKLLKSDFKVSELAVQQDADMLIAYSTTEDNVSFRNENTGAVFIQVLLAVVKEYYKESHLEEMLVIVRHRFLKDQIKQMPCTWSTLTKLFYLKNM